MKVILHCSDSEFGNAVLIDKWHREKNYEMKDLWKNGIIVLLIIGSLYVIYLKECRRDSCPPTGQVLISQSVWDSILALANKPSEIRIDTQWVKADTIFIEKPVLLPQPQPTKDSLVYFYSDTLSNKYLHVSYNFYVQGKLVDRFWAYTPISLTVNKEIIKYVPNIIQTEKFVKIEKNALYMNIVFGGNANSFILGGGLDFTTRKGTELGYMYQRFGKESFHNIRLGTRLFSY